MYKKKTMRRDGYKIISMENSSIDQTTTITTAPNQFPISLTDHQQHQYPVHHPTQLAELLALISPEAVVLLLNDIPNCNSSDGIPTTQPALGQLLVVPIAENEHHHSTPIEFESPDSQNEQPVMMTTLSIQHSDHDSSILIERGDTIEDEDQSIDLRLTGLHGCLDPKSVAYLLRVYPIFLGLVAGKSLCEKRTPFPTTNPFMILSIVVYAMTYMNLLILYCIYDGLPRQTFSPVHYKISKYVFYILCFVAPFLLLPLLFIPGD